MYWKTLRPDFWMYVVLSENVDAIFDNSVVNNTCSLMENRYYRVSISATHIEDTKLLRKY
jgi:hypothetical protein